MNGMLVALEQDEGDRDDALAALLAAILGPLEIIP